METPQFPHHRDCEALTGITIDHLPRDGSLGRVRRFAKGAYLWQADDAADRIYFLRRGRVVVMTAKPHERPVALNTIVSDVVQLYSREASGDSSAAHVPVHMDLDTRAPAIMGDAQQLRQVIHNLLQNAQDATEGAPVREVTIRTQWSPERKRVRLVVQDTGTGFPEHILKRAFEPYVTTKDKGTGLGLAVVKKIADEHAARVDLKNRVEEGTVRGAQVSLSFAVAA